MRRNPAGLLTKTAALVAGVLALTGCIKMDMDMKLSSDDKVSGTVIVGFNGALFEAMGQKPADVIKEMETEAKAELKKPENKLKTGTVSVKGYNKNGFVGLESSFKGILLTDLKKATGVASDAAASTGGSSASEDDFKIERKGNTYVFTGVMDLSDMADSSATTVKGQKTTTTMGIPASTPPCSRTPSCASRSRSRAP